MELLGRNQWVSGGYSVGYQQLSALQYNGITIMASKGRFIILVGMHSANAYGFIGRTLSSPQFEKLEKSPV